MSPPLAVLATLVVILIVPRRVPMWASFLAGCLALPLLCGKGLAESAWLWREAATDRGTLLFAGLCACVFLLSSILTHGRHLATLCEFASAGIPNRRLRAAVMPALVGLVPMPGGAVVSAPLIDQALGDAPVSPTDRNLVNYWFRHIWEVSWPLYPSVVLAAAFLGPKDAPSFMSAQAPLTLVLAVCGYFALLRRVPKSPEPPGPRPPASRARAILPLVVLVAVPLAASAAGRYSGTAVPIAAVGAAIVVALLTAIDFPGLARVPFDRRVWSMTALAYLIQVFGELVRETGASGQASRALSEAGLPSWASLLLVPYLVGFATGNTQTYVTMAFPVVMPALRGASLLPALVLGYAGGFLGYLTSPVHMCLVLSTRYFNAKLLSAYARLAGPLLVFLAAAVALSFALGGRVQP